MPTPVQRVASSPCEWCGKPIQQPPRGRRLRYCDRSCRQRAYEARTAERRLQRDLAAGRIRAEPAERVVERLVQPRRPRTAMGWSRMLDALTEQLHAGKIPASDRSGIRAAAGRLQAALDAPPARSPAPSTPATGPAPAPLLPLGSDQIGQIHQRLAAGAATRTQPTTLTLLARELAVDVDQLRTALAALTAINAVQLWRNGMPVDPLRIAEHNRISIVLLLPVRADPDPAG